MFRTQLSRFACVPLILSLLCCQARLYAAAWAELGDAGDLPASAQTTLGVGSLDLITGTISTSMDKDVYEISIVSPATFSAIVLAGGSLIDSQLFLLDPLGSGVYGNDDTTAVNPLSTLPAGDTNSPTIAGDYLLAISGKDNDPMSGAIETFTDNAVGVQTPATAVPVDGWSLGFSEFGGTYSIALTGAEFSMIPEPSALVLSAVGILSICSRRKRRY